jgi:PPM family protein phosphatase
MSRTDSLKWAAATEKGPVRAENQDAWEVRPESGVAVVADGVGGGPGGARASRIAAEIAADELAAAPWPDDSGDARYRAIRKAHEAVSAIWRDEPALVGMATTLTAVRWIGDRVEGVHVGDSRAYRLSPGTLEPLTRDHTPAGAYLAHKGGDREILRTHPRRNLLLQAVGGADAPPDPDLFEIQPVGSDLILTLCSDGIEAALSEERFRELLAPALSGDLDGALQAVLDAALREGAPDNATLVLLSRG